MDSHLDMKKHIGILSSACFYQLRRLRSLRSYIDNATMQTLVSAFILARLDYCNSTLANLPTSTLAPLQRVMNAAARLVINCRSRDHVTPVLKKLHWLPIRHRISYKLCLLVHLALQGKTPPYVRSVITPVSEIPSRSHLRSATSNDLQIPASRLKLSSRAFCISGPTAWNALPPSLKSIQNLTNFKKKLKTHLFPLAYA